MRHSHINVGSPFAPTHPVRRPRSALPPSVHGAVTRAARLVSVGLLAACDVTNPGPVRDEFVATEESQQGLINGAIRHISEQMGDLTYTTALLGREVFPGGQTGAWGHDVTIQGGYNLPGDGPGFTELHDARFIAETAIKRFPEEGTTDDMMHQAHLWAGFAYRILGEWWCEAVLSNTDPDIREPGAYETNTTGYFQRAVDNFTLALEFATTDEQRHAALAGRAAANVWLERWAEAEADASQVPDAFVLVAPMTDLEEDLYNDFYEANSGTFRSYTVRFTWFYDYYEQTGDPRTRWGVDPAFPVAVGSLSGFPGGQVPYNPQLKYPDRSSDINLASGWEMRLIEAEAKLVAGDWQGAMNLINQVRTRNISEGMGQPLDPWNASGLAEAWTFLTRERYIELWLEGRRMGDERRWLAIDLAGPFDSPAWEDPSHAGYTPMFLQNPRSYCFDIPDEERTRNPNVPERGG